MAEMDSGTAYNDLLERAKQTSAKVAELESRIKALEDRAAREEAKAQAESMAQTLAQMAREGK